MNRGLNPGGDSELFTSCNMRDCMQFTSSLSVEDWDIRLPLIWPRVRAGEVCKTLIYQQELAEFRLS